MLLFVGVYLASRMLEKPSLEYPYCIPVHLVALRLIALWFVTCVWQSLSWLPCRLLSEYSASPAKLLAHEVPESGCWIKRAVAIG
jgi:hypothetical protein